MPYLGGWMTGAQSSRDCAVVGVAVGGESELSVNADADSGLPSACLPSTRSRFVRGMLRGVTEESASLPSIELQGIPLVCLTVADARIAVRTAMEDPRPALVAYVNAHSLNLAYTDVAYRAALQRAHLVLPDGIGVAVAARMRGLRFAANLNGTDFTPVLLALAAEQGYRVFLFGGRDAVASQAAEALRARIPGLCIAGVRDGYGWADDPDSVVEEIRAARADLLVTALGNPLQELWLDRYLEATGVRLGVGVGAFLDFTAGRVPRAPDWMIKNRLEWVWRLSVEPRRMWRRYLVGNPLFIWRTLVSRQPPAQLRLSRRVLAGTYPLPAGSWGVHHQQPATDAGLVPSARGPR